MFSHIEQYTVSVLGLSDKCLIINLIMNASMLISRPCKQEALLLTNLAELEGDVFPLLIFCLH